MNADSAISIFDTLSQETRLSAFRLLVKAGRNGLAAGAIGSELGIAHNTLSFHLSHLLNSGMLTSHKQGRSIIYRVNFETVSQLIEFLIEDCCSSEFASIHKDNTRGCSVVQLLDPC